MPHMIPVALSFLALLVLGAAWRFSARSRRPKLLKIGAGVAALGLVLLWGLPWWLFSGNHGELLLPLFIGALFIPVSCLGLGMRLVATACGEPENTAADRVFHDCLTQNRL